MFLGFLGLQEVCVGHCASLRLGDFAVNTRSPGIQRTLME
jgi:hypothetical protein